MAIKLAAKKNRGSRNIKIAPDINITPLVDVMLVLLIIFMLTAPMLVSGINVDLPETSSAPIAGGQDQPLVVSIDAAGDIYIIDSKVASSQLVSKLIAITKEKRDTRIFVKGDKNLPYGKIVHLMAEIQAAGFSKVALVSNVIENQDK